jgi:transposase InsO family protein
MIRRAPLTEAEKRYLWQRKEAGATLHQLAEELHCAVITARKWWRHGRDQTQPRRRGRPVKGILSSYPTEMVERAVALKRSHPHWGPANVKLEMQEQMHLTVVDLPSDARLAALFKSRCPEALQPRRHTYYPEKPLGAARYPHQRWQVDAQEKIRLTNGEVATILNIRDEWSGVIAASRAFMTTTVKGWRKLTLAEVQTTLRQAFAEWGRPDEVQTDHEVVYTGSPAADFPGVFSLWLLGLGISHVTGRSRRPTDQAEVERTHRTVGDMAWKDEACETIAQLQTLLDQRRCRYNQHYPSHAGHCQGQPPLTVCPSAHSSGRPFRTDIEWELFCMEWVECELARRVWTRQVSDSGGVGIGNHLYSIGRAYAGQTVAVSYRPATHTFHFELADGTTAAEVPARALAQADLIGYIPVEGFLAAPFQLPLALEGV